MIPIPRNRIKSNGKVDLWDIGPQVAPKPPDAPIKPDAAKFKHPADLALAEVEFETAIELYKEQLREYAAAKKDHLSFARDKGGPVKVEFWGADVYDAFERAPGRYVLDLPKNLKPGKAQAEAERQAEATAEEIQQAKSKDPMHSGAMA